MNYMKKIAEMLEVKLGEEFYVIDTSGLRTQCRLTRKGTEFFNTNASEFYLNGSILFYLLTGDYRIEKQWKPTAIGDDYYYPSLVSDDLAASGAWLNDLWGNNLYNRGLVFQTKEEAQEACRAMLKAIKK